jgi:DNA-binding transcriptional MerR regulator
MTVIANTTLLIRRIAEVRRRREAIVDRQDRLRGSLPQWALAPLQLVGLTAAEIQGLMSDLSEAEKQSGLEDVERELELLDQQIEELENMLLTTPSRSLDGIQAVLEMAVTRFRGQTVTDPGDVFYDYGDARILTFLERATDDLRNLLAENQRQAS